MNCRQYRAKNGTPGIHGLQGEELRLLRVRREHPHADFVFLSERKAPLSVGGAQKLIAWPLMLTCCGTRLARPWRPVESIQGRCDLTGHRSIANTVVYTSVADKRVRNIWAK